MPQDGPDLADLLRTVNEFLQALSPKLEGQDRYFSLCSLYLLGIAERELEQWSRTPGDDDARLASALGTTNAVINQDLMGQLCKKIRAGDFDQRMDDLMTLVEAHVTDKVRISNPEHLADPAT